MINVPNTQATQHKMPVPLVNRYSAYSANMVEPWTVIHEAVVLHLRTMVPQPKVYIECAGHLFHLRSIGELDVVPATSTDLQDLQLVAALCDLEVVDDA